jgi:rhodanese-related sulfurtransferase
MFARLMGLKTISPKDLHGLVQAKAVSVFDVNSVQSWNAEHVPGATRLDPTEYSEKDLPSDRNAAVVFYCSNFLCRKAPNAARRATQMGYTDVRVMSSGISGWLSAGLPTDAAR